MRKFLTAGVALAMLAGGAATASGQPYQREARQAQREYQRDVREARREYRQDVREARQDARQDERRYRRAERRFRAGAYAAPRGYTYRQWAYGQRLPRDYYASRYQLRNYGSYGLYAPPRGYVWTRVGNDAVLTAVTTGIIAGVVASLFY